MYLFFDGILDSSGESDSSEDSDIEGETASALFMAVKILYEWRTVSVCLNCRFLMISLFMLCRRSELLLNEAAEVLLEALEQEVVPERLPLTTPLPPTRCVPPLPNWSRVHTHTLNLVSEYWNVLKFLFTIIRTECACDLCLITEQLLFYFISII